MSFWSPLITSRLLRKGSIYLFSSWVSQGVMFLAWLVLPWKLSAPEMGQFALAGFVTDLLARLILMGMDSALLRFYVEEARRPELLRAAWLWLGIGAGASAGLLWVTYGLVPSLIKGLAPIYADLTGLMLLTAAATAFATIVFSHHVASGEAASFGRLTVLRSLLLGGGYAGAAWSGLGVAGLLGAQLVASLAICVCFCRTRHGPAAGGFTTVRALREVGGYGAPMMVYTIFSLLSDYAGRLFLERQVTLGDLGVFQFYYQIASQVNGVWGSLNRAWTPHLFQLLHASRLSAVKEMIQATAFATAAYAAGLAVFMAAGAFGLWRTVVPPAFYLRIDLFYLLLLGPLYGCIYTAMYPVYYFEKTTVKVSIVQSSICVITILLTLGFTIKLKADGAAFSWVLGLFLTPMLYMASFPRLVKDLEPIALMLLIWGVAGGLVAFSLHALHSPLVAVGILVAVLGSILGIYSRLRLGS